MEKRNSTYEGLNISLEKAEGIDKEIQLKIFKECHPELDWISNMPDKQKEAVIEQQFAIEEQQLKIAYPEAKLNIIFYCGKPIGRLCLYKREDTDRIVEIGLLKEYRGQGIGRKIISKVIREAAERKKTVSLQVVWFNEAAYKFYEKLGFQVVENKGVAFEMIYIGQ